MDPVDHNANRLDLRKDLVRVAWQDGRSDASGSSKRSEIVRHRHLDLEFHEAALRGLQLGRMTHAWTPEDILDAVRGFYAKWGRPPMQGDFRATNGLPGYGTVWKKFGSVKKAVGMALETRRLQYPAGEETRKKKRTG